jgi:hypothetical protein
MNQGRLNLVSSPFLLGHSWLDLATQSHIRWVFLSGQPQHKANDGECLHAKTQSLYCFTTLIELNEHGGFL